MIVQYLPILFVCRSYILDQFIPYLTSFTLKGHQYQIEGHQWNLVIYIICNMYNEQPKKDLTISLILGVQLHSGTYMAKHSGSIAPSSSPPPPPPPRFNHPPPAPPTLILVLLMKRRNLIIRRRRKVSFFFFLVMCRDFFPHISIQSKCLVQNQFSRVGSSNQFYWHRK